MQLSSVGKQEERPISNNDSIIHELDLLGTDLR
jgi:hypothetical protein